ncbi:hypothetical protein EUGRSUZ_E02130 [Eucalyptus grandis]|uniref:Uncharacterized protein n=2 Tax=Eucalyptus grandis TaxID=71139 RepID=A0A059C6L9_EUCGR|nr:hypothetical protein EUGRSUZ_E02130 [Eucalyptus grandis]
MAYKNYSSSISVLISILKIVYLIPGILPCLTFQSTELLEVNCQGIWCYSALPHPALLPPFSMRLTAVVMDFLVALFSLSFALLTSSFPPLPQ